jgi:hypothetical protein
MTSTTTRPNETVRSSGNGVPPDHVKRRPFTIVSEVYLEHRIVLALSLGYIVSGGVALNLLGRRWPIEITAPFFALVWAGLTVLWLGWQFLRGPRKLRNALSGPRLIGALVVFLLTVPTQITFQALKQSIGPVVGFWADPALHRLDVMLHGGMAWRRFEWLLSHPLWINVVDTLYFAWFGILLVFVLWASWSQFRQLRQRALIAFLLLWIVAGTGAAGALASAGPCYYDQVTGDANPYAGLISRLDELQSSGRPLKARSNQLALWETRRNDRWAQFAGISAMPSLHVGLSVLFALIASKRSRVLAALLAAYAVVIQIGSVVLAWHYAIDGYLGAVLAWGCWIAAGRLAGWNDPVRTSDR